MKTRNSRSAAASAAAAKEDTGRIPGVLSSRNSKKSNSESVREQNLTQEESLTESARIPSRGLRDKSRPKDRRQAADSGRENSPATSVTAATPGAAQRNSRRARSSTSPAKKRIRTSRKTDATKASSSDSEAQSASEDGGDGEDDGKKSRRSRSPPQEGSRRNKSRRRGEDQSPPRDNVEEDEVDAAIRGDRLEQEKESRDRDIRHEKAVAAHNRKMADLYEERRIERRKNAIVLQQAAEKAAKKASTAKSAVK